jgi:hypothetical protein
MLKPKWHPSPRYVCSVEISACLIPQTLRRPANGGAPRYACCLKVPCWVWTTTPFLLSFETQKWGAWCLWLLILRAGRHERFLLVCPNGLHCTGVSSGSRDKQQEALCAALVSPQDMEAQTHEQLHCLIADRACRLTYQGKLLPACRSACEVVARMAGCKRNARGVIYIRSSAVFLASPFSLLSSLFSNL